MNRLNLHRTSNKIIFLLIVSIGYLVRMYLILNKSINPDDINFYEIALSHSYSDLIQLRYWAIDYPQLFFILFKFISVEISQHLIILKIINSTFYLGSAVVLYKVIKLLFNHYSKYLNLIVFSHAFSPLFITADTTFNPYSGVLFISLLLIEFFLQIKNRFEKKKLMILSLTLLIGSFFSYAFYFVIVSLMAFLIIDTIINNNHPNKVRNFYILTILVFSSVPSILQLITHLPNFSPMSPYPTNIQLVLLQYFRDVWPLKNTVLSYIFILGFILFALIKSIQYKSIFIITVLATSFISYSIMDLLDLFLTTRLFFLFHLFILILLYSLTIKNKFLLCVVAFIYIVMSIPTLRMLFIHKTNKDVFKSIAKAMYETCSPDSFYIIDSSSYHYYPLYHYYIPFSRFRTQEKYECILAKTRTFDVDIKRATLIDYSAKKYYFINLNNKVKRSDFWSNLCTIKKKCFVYAPKSNTFIKTSRNKLHSSFNSNNIRSEFE